MKERVAGLGFIVVLTALLGVCVATYLKMFTPSVDVTLQAESAGMQLSQGGDVKLNGVLVGEIRDVSSQGKGAEMDLALDPNAIDSIPEDVSARLLPKTLFGEKYVDLIVPEEASSSTIKPGTVINVDKSQQATELGDVLDNALPLLRSVPPEKLATTLTSLSTALDGRGDELGDSFVKLGDIVRTLNDEMPVIEEDIKDLATVLDNYQGALPDLIGVLENLAVTNDTIVDQSEELDSLWMATQDFSNDTRTFLDRYQGRIVQFGEVTAPFMDVLATYSPEYPCLFEGLTELEPNIRDAFSGGRLHITLEITQNNGKYEAGDEPAYESQRGPDCRSLPDPSVPAPERPFGNGYEYGSDRLNLPIEIPGLTDATSEVDESAEAEDEGQQSEEESDDGLGLPFDPSIGLAGSDEEKEVITPLVAAATEQDVEESNDDLNSLLWGPILRGAQVSVE